jgi:hypothetical protein
MEFGLLKGMEYIQFAFGSFMGVRRLSSNNPFFSGSTFSELCFLYRNSNHYFSHWSSHADEITVDLDEYGDEQATIRLTKPARTPDDIRKMRNYIRRKLAPKKQKKASDLDEDVPF